MSRAIGPTVGARRRHQNKRVPRNGSAKRRYEALTRPIGVSPDDSRSSCGVKAIRNENVVEFSRPTSGAAAAAAAAVGAGDTVARSVAVGQHLSIHAGDHNVNAPQYCS